MNQNYEQDVIEQLKAGEATALEWIFNEYRPALCVFADVFFKDQEASKKNVDEVFVLLWEDRTAFNSLFEIKAFLYHNTVNAGLRHLNFINIKELDLLDKEQNWLVNEATPQEREDFAHERMRDAEFSKELNTAIKSLPPQMQQVLLPFIDGVDIETIAQDLGLAREEVLNRKKEALNLLKERFDSEDLYF